MDYTIIGKNIENLRNSKNMRQEEFAKILGTSRPTVSNWEQGKNPPTTDQLIKLSETFHISIDELLGLKTSKKQMVIVDSSILCRRPRILDDMMTKEINYICITETVLSEMNHQKDNGKRHQQAWLAMKSFNDHRNEDNKRFLILPEYGNPMCGGFIKMCCDCGATGYVDEDDEEEYADEIVELNEDME